MFDERIWIRLYLDHNVHLWIADDLRRRGLDAVAAIEVGNERAEDEDHRRWATDHGRTVLTYDRDDFPRIHRDWLDRGERHAGIIVSVAPPKLPASELIRRLHRFLETMMAEEMAGEIEWLDARW